MAAAQLGTVLQHLRRLADRQQTTALTDAQLLELFCRRRDETAFGALLDRHGPTVFGVCRRLLHEPHDAEDAFQATFLVFVRKAGSIGKGDALGYWLYEVAYRTARRAKVNAARRRSRERQVQPMTDTRPVSDLDWAELQPILDSEVHQLRENYRRPFVLCYLEGKTHAEAAAQLGWPKGTVSGRLARARGLLQKRLARHGITLTAAVFSGPLSRSATAAVPVRLIDSTLRAGLLFAAGKAPTACASAEAVGLSKEVLRVMLLSKTKLLFALLAAVCIVVGIAQYPSSAGDLRPPPKSNPANITGEARLPTGAIARMGGTELRHGDRVHFVAFTPDGKQLVTAGVDQTVRVWDVASGREFRCFHLPPLSKSRPQENPAARRPIELAVSSGLFPTALSVDGKRVAAARDDDLLVWDLETGKELHRIQPRTFGSLLAFTPSGGSLQLINAEGGLSAWDLRTGKQVRTPVLAAVPPKVVFSRRMVGSPAVSADGTLLAFPKIDPQTKKFTIRVIDPRTEKQVAEIEAPPMTAALTFSPDGKTLAWGVLQGRVHLWDVPNRKEIAVLAGTDPPRRVTSLAFSRSGDRLAMSREDGSIELWDVASRKRLLQLVEPSVPVGATLFLLRQGSVRADLAFSPDGKRLAVGAFGSRIRLFDTDTGKEEGPGTAGHADAVRTFGLSPDGKSLVSHGRGDVVRFWDLASGKELRHVRMPGNTASTALSPDGSLLAAVNVGMVTLYDPATGQERQKLDRPQALGGALTFSADGKTLALRQDQGQVRLWDVATGKALPVAVDEVPVLERGTAGFTSTLKVQLGETVLSPDGTRWVSSDAENRLVLYETESGVRLGEFKLANDQVVRRAEFSPDGRSLATANQNGTITLYETATCRKRATLGKVALGNLPPRPALVLQGGRGLQFQGGSETPFALAFSHDGRVLAANPSGAKVGLWDVWTGKQLITFHGHQGGIASLAFSADDKRLISGSLDSTVLVWDTSKHTAVAPPSEDKLAADNEEKVWADLCVADAERAFAMMRNLTAAPADAVVVLKRRLQSIPKVEPGRIERLIAELDAKGLAARQTAAAELEKLGDLIRPAVRQAIAKGSTLETRQRLEKMLHKLRVGAISGEVLGALRGIEVLEYVGTSDARHLLRTLADGAPGARQTEAARESLSRLLQTNDPRSR
jgi:RNA polymerase sigma factor (sigma-70 family)